MSRVTHSRRALVVGVVVGATALLTACGGGAAPPAGPSPQTSSPTSSPTSSSTSSSTPGPAPEPTTVMGRRCGPPDLSASVSAVAGPGGARVGVTTVGRGGTVAVLLHQTGRTGACGWWPYVAPMVAAGATVVLVDFCGYGASSCPAGSPWEADYVAQVVAVVDRLRAGGARRVTLVGASLGGTVAVAAAGPARADAVVDLSGFGFADLTTTAPLARLRVPVLAAGSRDELADSDRLAREVASSPAPVKRFVQTVTGHGWSLMADTPLEGAPLTPLGEAVVRWAAGRTG